jgi:CheY-like chemotaxis protein
VLLDLFMPGMSGFDVLAALRSTSDPPPAIVITAHDEPELVRHALDLNAVACLRKPVAAPDLLDAIARSLRRG